MWYMVLGGVSVGSVYPSIFAIFQFLCVLRYSAISFVIVNPPYPLLITSLSCMVLWCVVLDGVIVRSIWFMLGLLRSFVVGQFG